MIDGVRLKVCGLTSLVDAECADRAGADYLGFILVPKSPRFLSLRQYHDMAPRLPEGRKRVAVLVEPDEAELAAVMEAGFDRVQIHFTMEVGEKRVAAWSTSVGRDRLWLAPKLPPEVELPESLLESAETVLMDTFHRSGFGGSGLTGDWGKFARYRERYPRHTWILAGGLNPTNIAEALASSGANFVDVNSGVEVAPGIKDHAKLRAFIVALHRARTAALEARQK